MYIKPSYWPMITVAIIVVLLAYGLTQDPRILPSALKAKPAPRFALKDLQHPEAKVTEAIFQKHLTIVNIWASWCTPCRVEHQLLIELKKRYPQVQWLGINYKDDVEMARSYLESLGDPYDYVVADVSGKLGLDWGIYGTPETFLVDATGKVLHRHAGVLTPKIWHHEFEQLVKAYA